MQKKIKISREKRETKSLQMVFRILPETKERLKKLSLDTGKSQAEILDELIRAAEPDHA